jgi:hypothetical protein
MFSVEIDKIDDRENDVRQPDQQGNGKFIVKGEGTEEPVAAMGALDEPPALDDSPAARTVVQLSRFSLFPEINVPLQFLMNIQALSTFTALDISGLEVIPYRFLAACRTFDYKHKNRSPLCE